MSTFDPGTEIHGSDPQSAILEGAGEEAIQGRSLSQIAWRRLRRDKVAIAGGCFIIFLILVAIFAPLITKITGGPPNEFHEDMLDMSLGGIPYGFFGGMSWQHPMGLDIPHGRDIFSRVVYGTRISLLIAMLATAVSVTIGTTVGIIAGFFGGWVDAFLSRLMDMFLAFPLLVFALALAGVMPQEAFGLSGLPLRLVTLVAIIGFFNWPYIGRIVRGQAMALREREYIDAARSLGAKRPYILFSELLPNLMAPILVYSTLIIPTNILFEAALSFLGVGVPPPTASWGGMLADAVTIYTQPHFMFWPGMAIFLTVLAFNLFGDGLRDAFDPKGH
ncbi:MAG TPA: ABC transporter permease [Marmoricola sp.]|nr:ABC transporter permease [Marmoricola sp.]